MSDFLNDGLTYGESLPPPVVPEDPTGEEWRGPQGEPGPTGATGATGPAGAVPEAPSDGSTYGRLNAAWTQVLPIAGGTLTGALTLAADPAANLQAATKQYADTKLPLAGGTLTGALTLSGAPTVNLHAATKLYVDGFLPLGGGILTGALTLAGAPTVNLHAATKLYADSKFPLAGVTDASSATAGNIGEVITATGSAVANTNGTPTNCTSILLTAGDWDVFGNITFVPTGGTYSQIQAGANTTSATLPASPTGGYAISTPGGSAPMANTSLAIATHRRNVSASTTVYLVGQASFGAGTSAMTGILTARRVR